MDTITVPDSIGKLLVPGVPLVAAIVEGVDPLNPALGWRSLDAAPPAWSVALRDARCETCVDEYGERVMQNCNNPRCHNGRLLHDVRVECRDCLPDHPGWRLSGGNEKRLPDGRWVWLCSCRHPDRPFDEPFGYRTVRCLIDVVRAVDGHTTCPDSPHLFIKPFSGAISYCPGSKERSSRALTPAHVDALETAHGQCAEWPGRYAIVLTEVSE